MSLVHLKRDQFRYSMVQQQRLRIFQEKRNQFLNVAQNIRTQNEEQQTQYAIDNGLKELGSLINEFDTDETKAVILKLSIQIAEVLPLLAQHIQKSTKPNLQPLKKSLYGFTQYVRRNFDTPRFLIALEFLELSANKSEYFCNEYVRANVFREMQFNLAQFPEEYQIRILQHYTNISQIATVELPYNYISNMLDKIITKMKNDKSVILENNQLIVIIIDIFLRNDEQTPQKIKLQQTLNLYYLTVIENQNNLLCMIVENEMLNYLQYLQTHINLFDSSTIDLIKQLSFNQKTYNIPEEKAGALIIIGVLMSGTSEKTNYYFEKFSDGSISLDQRLLTNLNFQPQVRRATIFCFNNLFAEANIKKVNFFSNNTIGYFLRYAALEEDADVYIEVLQAISSLIYNTHFEYLPILIEQNIVQIILNQNYAQALENQALCIYYLIARFQLLNEEENQRIIGNKSILNYLFDQGVYRYFEYASFNAPEKGEYLIKLCQLLWK